MHQHLHTHTCIYTCQGQIEDLSHGQQWLAEKLRRQEKETDATHAHARDMSLARDQRGGAGVGGAGGSVAPRATVSADVVLDDGTRHVPLKPLQADDRERGPERERVETELLYSNRQDHYGQMQAFRDGRRADARPLQRNSVAADEGNGFNGPGHGLSSQPPRVRQEPGAWARAGIHACRCMCAYALRMYVCT